MRSHWRLSSPWDSVVKLTFNLENRMSLLTLWGRSLLDSLMDKLRHSHSWTVRSRLVQYNYSILYCSHPWYHVNVLIKLYRGHISSVAGTQEMCPAPKDRTMIIIDWSQTVTECVNLFIFVLCRLLCSLDAIDIHSAVLHSYWQAFWIREKGCTWSDQGTERGEKSRQG